MNGETRKVGQPWWSKFVTRCCQSSIMIILDLYQIPDHSHIPNTTVLQLKKLKLYSTDCSLGLLKSTSLKNMHHIRQNSTNVEYPNLHYKQHIPFMNMWGALQRTTMPEDHSITRLTQLNHAITDFHTNIHLYIHKWKSHKQSVPQFNQYLVIKLYLQIKFMHHYCSNKMFNC